MQKLKWKRHKNVHANHVTLLKNYSFLFEKRNYVDYKSYIETLREKLIKQVQANILSKLWHVRRSERTIELLHEMRKIKHMKIFEMKTI